MRARGRVAIFSGASWDATVSSPAKLRWSRNLKRDSKACRRTSKLARACCPGRQRPKRSPSKRIYVNLPFPKWEHNNVRCGRHSHKRLPTSTAALCFVQTKRPPGFGVGVAALAQKGLSMARPSSAISCRKRAEELDRRSVPRLLCRFAGLGDEAGDGASDADAQERGHYVDTLEEGGAFRRRTSETASSLSVGKRNPDKFLGFHARW